MWRFDEELKERWSSEQKELKRSLVEADELGFQWADADADLPPLKFVAGVDLRYIGNTDEAVVSLVIVDWPEMKTVYESYLPVNLTMPAMPGYLGFREAGPIMELLKKVITKYPDISPQVILVHGSGKYDVDGFGVACHVGGISGIPTVGVTTEWLELDGISYNQILGLFEDGSEAVALLGHSATLWGMAFIPPSEMKNGTKRHLYVSVGNKISLQTAVELVKATCISQLPEPVVLAIKCNEDTIIQRLSHSGAQSSSTPKQAADGETPQQVNASKKAAAMARQKALAAFEAAQKGSPPQPGSRVQQVGSDDGFIPINKFHGQVSGFVFKMGPKGLGYYRDSCPPSSPNRSQLNTIPASTPTVTKVESAPKQPPSATARSSTPMRSDAPPMTSAAILPPIPRPLPAAGPPSQRPATGMASATLGLTPGAAPHPPHPLPQAPPSQPPGLQVHLPPNAPFTSLPISHMPLMAAVQGPLLPVATSVPLQATAPFGLAPGLGFADPMAMAGSHMVAVPFPAPLHPQYGYRGHDQDFGVYGEFDATGIAFPHGQLATGERLPRQRARPECSLM